MDQKSIPVAWGELRIDRGASETNLVPRRRWSRMGRADGRIAGPADGNADNCTSLRFARASVRRSVGPTIRLTRISPSRTRHTRGNRTAARPGLRTQDTELWEPEEGYRRAEWTQIYHKAHWRQG